MTDGPAELWGQALRALANAVAHDLRNALNAVAVNLEVVRSRSARGAEPSAIAPFAATAAAHFETAAAAAEALLGFTRAEQGDADVAVVVGRLARLLAVSATRRLDFVDRPGAQARSTAPADVVRAVVARSVLAALETGDTISCEITVGDGILLSVTGATRLPQLPDSGLVTVASAYGIRIASRDRSLELRFPVVDSGATLHAPS